MRAAAPALLLALVTGCGEPQQATSDAAPDQAMASATASTSSATTTASAATKSTPGFKGRNGELINPDASTVVLLYYDLAGLPPQLEQWVQEDSRVKFARAGEKPAVRAAVRSELTAGLAGVHDIGVIRLSMQANLSEYDETYGEYTVRALAPSSVVEFKALGQNVALKFANARTAQTWRVPADQVQSVRDKIGLTDVSLDALLQIRDVHAAPAGGTITTDVIEYELRANHGGTLLGRVQLAQP